MKKCLTALGLLICMLLFSTPLLAADGDGVWVVKFKDSVATSSISALAADEDAAITAGGLGYYIVDEQTAKELQQSGMTALAYESGVATLSAAPNDPFYDSQWALSFMRWESARNLEAGKSSVTIGVIDSGYYYAHEDSGNVIGGYDFTTGSRWPDGTPGSTHGTNVTGVISAKVNNGIGIAGATENCGVIQYHVFTGTTGINANIAKAVIAAVDDGCDVLNMSFGTYDDEPFMRDAINYAASKNVLMVAAAGNDGNKSVGSRYQYPAGYSSVISVGALVSPVSVADFSQHNDSVYVVAPGNAILTLSNLTYGNSNGTSLATPYVAALAALCRSVDGGLTISEFKSLLRESAIDMGAEGYDNYYGWGAIDFYTPLVKLVGVPQDIASAQINAETVADLVIPGTVEDYDADAIRTLTATAIGTDGSPLIANAGAVWELVAVPQPAGVSLNGSVLTVTKAAAEQTITLQVTITDKNGNTATAQAPLKLVKKPQAVGLALTRSSFALPTTAEGDVDHALSFTAQDQYGEAMDGGPVQATWGLMDSVLPPVGVRLNENTGVLTVNSTARLNKEIPLFISVGGIDFGASVTLTAAASAWSAVLRGEGLVMPGSTVQYSVAEIDQYGNERAAAGYSWSLLNAGAGVTIDNSGRLTVVATAADQTFTVNAIDGSQNARLTVAVKQNGLPGDGQAVPTAFGSYTVNNGVATVTLDRDYVLNLLAAGKTPQLALSGLSCDSYVFLLDRDLLRAMDQKGLALDTPIGGITLPANTYYAAGSVINNGDLAAADIRLTISRATLDAATLPRGGALAGEAVRFALTVNGEAATDDDLMESVIVRVPATAGYTTLVRQVGGGALISVPTQSGDQSQAVGTLRGLGVFAPATRSVSFSDVPSRYWAAATIRDMAGRFIIDGKTATTFAPEDPITRAEFCALLVRALGIAPVGGDALFADTPAGAWYTPYVNAANLAGIVNGVTDTTFSPLARVTREQAAAMMVRAAGYAGLDVYLDDAAIAAGLARFKDGNKVARWARETMAQALELGIVSGYPNKTLGPQNDLSRAEGARMIRNMLEAADLI